MSVKIEASGESFDAEVADSFLSRAQGLSFRSTGRMLFVFPRESRPAIDMMFVSRPLQLYFIDSGKKVVDVQKAEPWTFNPLTWRLYRPRERARYLLESFEELGLDEGDNVDFQL